MLFIEFVTAMVEEKISKMTVTPAKDITRPDSDACTCNKGERTDPAASES